MAREVIHRYTSDVSGNEIQDETKAVTVRVTWPNSDRAAMVWDAMESEIEIPKTAREDARKGRPRSKT